MRATCINVPSAVAALQQLAPVDIITAESLTDCTTYEQKNFCNSVEVDNVKVTFCTDRAVEWFWIYFEDFNFYTSSFMLSSFFHLFNPNTLHYNIINFDYFVD